jgi:ATP-dependent helicase/DNAse subunit B
MIRFYYQGQSEGTKALMLEHIKADLSAGGEVLLLVPEQETVSTERRMLEALPPAAQLCFEVVNFSRLANRVFRVLGGHRFRTASPAVRALLMWQSLRRLAPLLDRYATHANEPHLCDMMLDTAKKCRAYCIGANDLLETADALPQEEPLAGKLRDLGSVSGCFEAELDERSDHHFLDPVSCRCCAKQPHTALNRSYRTPLARLRKPLLACSAISRPKQKRKPCYKGNSLEII